MLVECPFIGLDTFEHCHDIVLLAFLFELQDCFEHCTEQFLCLDVLLWLAAVVAVATFIFLVVFTEVVEQSLATAHACLGVCLCLTQKKLANLLFGIDLVLHELLKLEEILVTVEGNTFALTAITTGTACLLIVAFKALWHVVVDHVAHIWLIDTHTEGDSCYNDINTFHEEVILILRAHVAVHTCMVRTA